MSQRHLAPGEYPWPPQRSWPKGEGPFVRAVTLCEAVLNEHSGGVSLIRLLNTMYIGGEPTDPVSFPVTLFVSLERLPGDEPQVPIRIIVVTPIGMNAVDEEVMVEPTGTAREATVNFQMQFPVLMDGTHHIAVAFEDRLLTTVTVDLVFLGDNAAPRGGTPIHSRWEVKRVSSPWRSEASQGDLEADPDEGTSE